MISRDRIFRRIGSVHGLKCVYGGYSSKIEHGQPKAKPPILIDLWNLQTFYRTHISAQTPKDFSKSPPDVRSSNHLKKNPVPMYVQISYWEGWKNQIHSTNSILQVDYYYYYNDNDNDGITLEVKWSWPQKDRCFMGFHPCRGLLCRVLPLPKKWTQGNRLNRAEQSIFDDVLAVSKKQVETRHYRYSREDLINQIDTCFLRMKVCTIKFTIPR